MAELFGNFEINRVPRWPIMSRLLTASVVLHGLFFVAVVYVPKLQSLFRVAGEFAGIQFVNEDYDKTLIGQRATLVKLEPYQKLYYPPDYFAPNAPVGPDPMLMAQQAPPPPPVFIPRPRPVPRMRARRIPTPAASPTPQPAASPEVAKASASPTPGATPTLDEKARAEAEKKLDEVAGKYNTPRPPTINTKPFADLATKGKEMIEQGSLKLDGTIDVTAEGERNEDGTLNRDTVKLDGFATDAKLEEFARALVNAISESKVLVVLKGAKTVKMSLKLDGQNVSIKIVSEVESEARASEMLNGLGLMLAAGRIAKQGTDEGELYKNLKVDRDGKQFLMTFEMPRDAAGKMIAQMLAKQKPSGD
ncbi:MAG: hypothetical protein LC754_06360 [Acidobacteria bacterium]|nr:hypothetical protein [Acidobacteriota bacterium]